MTGATAVLADVDPSTLNLSVEAMQAAITSKTKAIVPVHVSGRAAEIENIVRIARERGLTVVEDAAEAFRSRHDNRCLGTFGQSGCFSFSRNKVIATEHGRDIIN